MRQTVQAKEERLGAFEIVAREQWVFDPDSGGVKIPERKKREVTRRIERFAAENYAG
ncbi:MAG: hypothetical protein RRC07_09945 [Anaerolineae bacterium]|nr:hypothetical protein [Anaerolineae bacterium]